MGASHHRSISPSPNVSQYLRGPSGYWQLIHVALVLLDPRRIDQAIPGGIQVLVSTTDRPVTYVNYLGDLLWALALAHQVGGHVDAGCHDGQRRSASQDARGGDTVRQLHGDAGKGVFEAEEVAESVAHVTGLGRGGGLVHSIVGGTATRHDSRLTSLIVLGEELLQGFVNPANLLSADLGDGEDLRERTRNLALAASNEDAARDEDILGLALECLGVIDSLEQVLGSVGHVLLDIEPLTHCANLLVCLHQGLVLLVAGLLVLGAVEVARSACGTTGDRSLQLVTVQQGVGSISNTRGVIRVLVVVREGTPFRAHVDSTVSEDQAATATGCLVGVELQVGRHFLAFTADDVRSQVLSEGNRGHLHLPCRGHGGHLFHFCVL